MKVDYSQIQLTTKQKARLIQTIYRNPYIQHKPFAKQLYALADESKRKLIGGSAFSGKSLIGAVKLLQYFPWENYRGLVVRKTYDDVIATGGVVDYLSNWLDKFKHVEHNKSEKVFHNTENNAKIFYSYALYEEDRKKFKGRAYHTIVIDEASELLKKVLTYFNRSLRDNDHLGIPLSLNYISNPDYSSGIELLKKKFVRQSGKWPYYEINFWDNPHVDAEDYKEGLKELSIADYQFQMGNWEYTPQQGDIFSMDMIIRAEINREIMKYCLKNYGINRIIRGWDIAASDTSTASYTACTKLTEFLDEFRNPFRVVTDQRSTKKLPGAVEEWMHTIMTDDGPEVEQLVETQPAGAGKLLRRYWNQEFSDYNTSWEPAFKNKVIRAGKVVKEINTERLCFLENETYPYLDIFKKQAVNFPYFKKLKDDDPETLHSDRVDSLSIIVQHLTRELIIPG